MSELIEFIPSGVCTKKITFELDNDGKIYNLKFYGGCNGNLSAIAKLLEGADALKTIKILRGNDCRGRGTSCADQLAIALEEAMSKQEMNKAS